MSEVGFILQKVNTEEFATIKKDISEGHETEVDLHVNIGFGINTDERFVMCLLEINYVFHDSPIIILKLNCEFAIEDSAWYSFVDDRSKTITFPQSFLEYLAVITVGTARGVIHAKTENTPYNKYYLPTLNVREMLSSEGDISFDIE